MFYFMLVVFYGWNASQATLDNAGYAEIKELLNKYHRPITVLEIGVDSVYYAFDIAKEYDCTSVIMYVDKLHDHKQYAKVQDFENVVIVNPQNVTHDMLQTVTRCEHFDVVIVHGVPEQLKKDHILRRGYQRTLDLIMKLGDFTFIQTKGRSRKVASYCQSNGKNLVHGLKGTLYGFQTPKKGLDIARWNYRHLPMQETPRYPIDSNFTEKKYYKNFAEQGIPWLKGMNLVTFVMLRGLYPTNMMISRQIEEMKKSKHNDAIIGNMIVQGGNTVTLIDVGDPRYNANLERLLNAALSVFKGNDSSRLKNPLQTMLQYRNLVSKKK